MTTATTSLHILVVYATSGSINTAIYVNGQLRTNGSASSSGTSTSILMVTL